MKSLNTLNSSAFANSTINEFDAPNLQKININYIMVNVNEYGSEKITFTVGKKNFQDSPGVIQ